MTAIEAASSISPRDAVAILARRKWQVAGIFLLVVGIVTAITLRMPKLYESHMKILVKNERADVVVSAAGGDGSNFHNEVSETDINSEIELLNSFSLLQRVVSQCGLAWLQPRALKADPSAVGEQATLQLQHDLKITPVHKTNIIQIDYSAKDPVLATAVLRQLADSYLEEHLTVHSTPGTYQFFAQQAARYRAELTDAEIKLDGFRRVHSIVMLPQQKDAVLQKGSESEVALMQAEAAIREYTDKVAGTRRQLAAATSRVVTQSRTIPNQYSVEHLNSMLAELQNRRTLLLTKFQADDRLVLEAEKEISDTQGSLDTAMKATSLEQSTDINPVHQALEIDADKQQAELAGIVARRESLLHQVEMYRGQLMGLGDATGAYEDLTRDQKRAEENYLLYAKKTEEARIAESLDRQKIANVAIVEPPTEPHLPSKPNVKLNLVMGTLLAACLALSFAFAAEYIRQSATAIRVSENPSLGTRYLLGAVEQKSELEGITGLPVLATVSLTDKSAK